MNLVQPFTAHAMYMESTEHCVIKIISISIKKYYNILQGAVCKEDYATFCTITVQDNINLLLMPSHYFAL